jgi:hypothetical protein
MVCVLPIVDQQRMLQPIEKLCMARLLPIGIKVVGKVMVERQDMGMVYATKTRAKTLSQNIDQ